MAAVTDADAPPGALRGYGVSLDGTADEVYVVCLPEPEADPKWMAQVAASGRPSRTVFLGDADDRPTLASSDGRVDDADIRAATRILTHLGRGDSSTLVVSGGERSLPPEPGAAVTSVQRVYTRAELDDHLTALNQAPLDRVVRQLRSSLGIIPFVGAGMSTAFGFPGWGEFLRQAAEGQGQRSEVDALVGASKYEAAAELLERSGPDAFQRRLEDVYGIVPDPAKLGAGPLWALASLAHGPVVTTNFDHVLEHVFDAAGAGFRDDVIVGAQPDRIVRALHMNQHALLKIHGDADDRAMRTFTAWEYDQNWGAGDGDDRRPTLSSLAWVMFTNRPLLFLGASLEGDRTVDALQEIHARLRGLTHYAVVSANSFDDKLAARRRWLEARGIQPIFFAPESFGSIEDHVWTLHERTLGPDLAPASAAPARDAKSPPKRDDDNATRRFAAVGVGHRGAPGKTAGPGDVERIARAVIEGRLAFFLGAGAHLGSVGLGNDFVEALAGKFGVDKGHFESRGELARRIIDRQGETEVLREIKVALDLRSVEPSRVYRLLAALPGFLRAHDHDDVASQVVLTTNYDTMLERSFATAGEPFHLLTYLGSGTHAGRFAHRGPDGSVKIIERPDLLSAFKHQGSVLVKLNGGIAYEPAIPESVLFARGDYERLAGRIPEALPAVLRTALRHRALLFLGHGLAEADVEAVIRYSTPTAWQQRSWAVKYALGTESAYWEAPGLKLIDAELDNFVLDAHAAISQLVQESAGGG